MMKKIFITTLLLCAMLNIVQAQIFTISGTAYSACNGVACPQGRIVLAKQNNSGAVTYSVNPTAACHAITADTIKNLAAGTFTITGTDAASATASTVVTVLPNAANMFINAATTNLCNSGTANLSTTLSVSYNTNAAIASNYCNAYSAVTGFEEISAVTVGSFTSGSGCGFTGTAGSTNSSYSNHTNQIIDVVPGGVYACGITVDTCYTAGTASNSSTIYIDLNIDGDFNDPGERVYASAGTYVGGHTETGTITIPSDATIGYTRMRVINAQNNSGLPCGIFGAGEVEDYTVHIGQFANTFTWTNSTSTLSNSNTLVVNGLNAGTYTVSATDVFGCTYTTAVVITSTPATQPTIVRTDGGCSYAKLEATFATGSANIIWQPGGLNTPTITNLSSAIYTLTATDANGCVATSTSLVDPAPPILANAIINNIKCAGTSTGSIILVPSGGIGPYFYQWTPASAGPDSIADNLSAQTYNVIINDAISCSQAFSFTLTQPNNPLSVGVLRVNISFAGANDGKVIAVVSGGTPPYTYAWSHGTSALDFIENCPPNIYTVTVTDAAGCSSFATADVFEPGAMSITSIPKDKVRIYPQPSESTINIEAEQNINEIILYDVAGKKLKATQFNNYSNVQSIDISELPVQIMYLQINKSSQLYKILRY
jgi:large repetitive protein